MQTELANNPVGEAPPPAPELAEPPPPPTEPEPTDVEAQPEDQDQQPPDDWDEVEYEGNKYRVPKAIAPALLRQADYTKKTQEVAEIRRAVEAEKARIADEAKAFAEDRQEHVQAYALWEQLQAFQNVNWQQLDQEDPLQAQQLFRQYTMLRDAHRDVVSRIQVKQQERASKATAEAARLKEQTRATLAREIPNWSKAEQELVAYAVKHGYKAEEVQAALDTDPRPFRFLHKAFLYDQLIEKQRKAVQPPPAEPIKPVGGNRAAPPQGLSDRLSTEEWVRRRNEQLRRKAAR